MPKITYHQGPFPGIALPACSPGVTLHRGQSADVSEQTIRMLTAAVESGLLAPLAMEHFTIEPGERPADSPQPDDPDEEVPAGEVHAGKAVRFERRSSFYTALDVDGKELETIQGKTAFFEAYPHLKPEDN